MTRARYLRVLALAVFAQACGVPAQSTQAPTEPERTSVPTQPTKVATLTPASTPTSLVVPSTSTAQHPTPTLRFNLLESPKLSIPETKATAAAYLSGSPSCILPCLYGIIPGRTTWADGQAQLANFARVWIASTVEAPFDHRASSTALVDRNGETTQLPIEMYSLDNTVAAIGTWFPNSPAFSLTAIVHTLGTPDEAWIRTWPEPEMTPDVSFGVALYYASNGVLAEYYISGTPKGDTISACPIRATSPFLGVWSPSLDLSFLEANRLLGAYEPDWHFRPFEAATGRDPVQYFQQIAATGSAPCIETPASMWYP